MTSNPMAQDRAYNGAVLSDIPMTISGTIHKTAILLLILVITAGFTWSLALMGFLDKATMLMWVGIGVGFIAAIVTSFKPKYAMPLSILYACCKGLAIGVISAMYQAMYDGIVVQAVGATILTLFAMLGLYRIGAIRATEKFRAVIFTATVGICVFYLINIIVSFLAPTIAMKFAPIWDSGLVGIGFSVFVIAIAALNFILDFDFIEKGAASFMPKYFEWYGGFTLLVTLIWLYLEMLRLLAKLRSR